MEPFPAQAISSLHSSHSTEAAAHSLQETLGSQAKLSWVSPQPPPESRQNPALANWGLFQALRLPPEGTRAPLPPASGTAPFPTTAPPRLRREGEGAREGGTRGGGLGSLLLLPPLVDVLQEPGLATRRRPRQFSLRRARLGLGAPARDARRNPCAFPASLPNLLLQETRQGLFARPPSPARQMDLPLRLIILSWLYLEASGEFDGR